MLHISRSSPTSRSQQPMSTNAKSVRLSLSATCHRYHELTLHDHLQDFSSDSPRRPYVRLALRVDCAAAPPHWDLTSGGKDLDISEEDGYVLSANGEASPSTLGVLVPCEPLTAVSRARPGRLRVKPWILHRRRVFDITTSPTSPTVSASSLLSLPPPPASSLTTLLHNQSLSPQPSGFRIRDRLPLTPSTPNTDFKNLCNNLRQRDALPKAASSEVPQISPISPPTSPAVSCTPSSPRQQRPVLHVQTSSPVGTSAPPPTAALPSPSPSPSQFRPSGRLPKRPALPVWPAEYYPRVVAV